MVDLPEMKPTKKLILIVCSVLMVLVCCGVYIVFQRASFKLVLLDKEGYMAASGLEFTGKKPHPLDGGLRLYIRGKKIQTTVPWGLDLKMAWQSPAEEVFSIYKGETEMMVWKVQDEDVQCLSGKEFITYDPYD